MKKLVLLACLVSGYLNANSQFTAGNLAVLRVGNGSSIGNNVLPVSILEYQTNGVTPIRTISIPKDDLGNRLTINPGASLEGGLSLSSNGQYLVFGGYGAAVGVTGSEAQGGTEGITSRKVFARIDADLNVDISTQFSVSSSNQIRYVVSNDGSSFWVVGANGTAANGGIGLYYTEFGSNTYTTLVNVGSRAALIAGGQLYSGPNINQVGTGLPTTTPTTATAYGTIPNNPNPFAGLSAYGFVLFDMSASEAGFDVLYIADQSGIDGLRKYSKVLGTWVSNGSLNVASLTPAPTNPGWLLDITGTLNEQNQPVLYATRGTGADNSLISIIDNGGYNTTITTINATPTHITRAGTGYTFKGVAFTPGTTVKVLPLDLTSFSSSLNNNFVSLKWTSENEVNVSTIEVQRKLDHTDFEKIGSVSPKNNKSANSYTFIDTSPAVGNNYYRLKVVDQDGSYKYSEVITEKVLSLQTASALSVYPNPASDMINVTHSKANAGATITIYNVNGKVELQEKVKENTTYSSIVIGKLVAGTYVLQINNGSEKESKTFIKK